jgi:cell pole-organizing protein PopZ
MAQEGEPSVEEILDSIKKVIARDNRAGATEQRRTRETRGIPEPEEIDLGAFEEEEVLDLDEASQLADLELSDALYVPEEAQEAPLVTEEARQSMQQSLEALAMLAEPAARPQIVRSGETSLEDLARELLRPALAEWLDANLPQMVERMVSDEIARIIGKRG